MEGRWSSLLPADLSYHWFVVSPHQHITSQQQHEVVAKKSLLAGG